jgi:hypothetical protein
MTIDFSQPAVMAALVGGGVAAGVSLIVALINQLSLRAMHRQKLSFDQEQAERRVTAEIALAEKKFRYDRELNDHKRRVELAEEVLSDFHEARDIILAARMPGSLGSEGDSRQKSPIETEGDTRTLNAYFTVAERLSKKTEFFAKLESRHYRFIANFGAAAAEPHTVLRKIHGEILVGVRMLLMTHHQRDLGTAPASIEHWQKVIWEMSDDDPIRQRLNSMVEAIEKVCRPAIQEAVK